MNPVSQKLPDLCLMSYENGFTKNDIEQLQPTEKIGILATVNEKGQPHITLITSLQPISENKMVFGQFAKGLSKKHVQENPKVAFLLMTLDRSLWRGRADYTHLRTEGPEYRMYNEKPMFRYNAYFGINTVYYFDLKALQPKTKLPLPAIIFSTLATRLARSASASKSQKTILNPLAQNMFNNLSALKFISWIKHDGYPALIPVLQCQAADTTRLAFSGAAFGSDLSKINPGTETAVFALTMKMEDVLVRGTFNGFARHRGVKLGTIDINWVYNSMPPAHGQVYPPVPLAPVTEFK